MREERPNVYGLAVSANADAAESARRPIEERTRSAVPEAAPEQRDSLREYFDVLRRRKLVVLASVLVAALIALGYSLSQGPRYRASASVLVTAGGAQAILNDVPGLAATSDPERLAATHVSLARLPVVAQNTVTAAGLKEASVAFLGRSSVTAETDTDILRFNVDDEDPAQAQRLATIYAQQFTRYRNQLDRSTIQSTRATIARTMARLAAHGQRASALYTELARAARQLDAQEAVQGSAAVVVQPAVDAVQTQPRTKRNLALAIILGLLYGVGLAFLIERLDTRVRAPEEIEAAMGVPALGELPRPPDLSKERRRVSMLDHPFGPYAESIRKLRANLEFASLNLHPRTLMITSSSQGEGKTTVAADLAVAFARAGRAVALCDLDARAPNLDRAFGMTGRRGLVEVALGLDTLERVLVPISWETSTPAPPTATQRWAQPTVALAVGDSDAAGSPGRGTDEGRLDFLPFGSRRPPDPGDFVGSSAVREVVEVLAETHDVVILDTAPLLPVSDARAISDYVDSVLVVCALKSARKPSIRRMRRLLSVLPSRVLGVAVTGVAELPGYGFYGDAKAQPRAAAKRPAT